MKYVYLVDTGYHHNWTVEQATAANHFSYIETDDIEDYIWDERCQWAESSGSQYAEWECTSCGEIDGYEFDCECDDPNVECRYEEEYAEFVERETNAYYFEYDPKLHCSVPSNRPEHLEWKKEEAEKEAARVRRYHQKELYKHLRSSMLEAEELEMSDYVTALNKMIEELDD